jgi:hypothetical protein
MSTTAPTNQRKAAKRIERALKKDPNNIRSLLQLAVTLDPFRPSDRDQKRKLLQQVLQLEPANQEARQMLFELDRMAIGGNPARLSAAVILTTPSSVELSEPPLTLRYSIVHQFLVYLSIVLTGFAGLSFKHDPEVFALIGGFFLSLLVPLWYVSGVIEIDGNGLHVSRLYGLARSEIRWNDVQACKSHAFGVKLITRHRDVIDVSAQVYGYAFILDILHQRRPDLFENAENTWQGNVLPNSPALTSVAAKTSGEFPG